MTVSRFIDRFDREDGEIGDDYTVPCGAAALFDESVIPVSASGADTPDQFFEGTTDQKTQVLYTAEALNGSDYIVRLVWSHLGSIPNYLDVDELLSVASADPAITLLARMTKDPMLVDLGTDEQPSCYDQGYGVRITCPRDGSAPILKLIKFSPRGIPPGIAGPQTSTEPDRAYVLSSTTLRIQDLNVDPSQDPDTTDPPSYRGFMQDTQLRVRRTDQEVILEVYQNNRGAQDLPLLSYTDRQHPLWGAAGVPGFEFLSAALAAQPDGASPFQQAGLPVMVAHLFDVTTVKDIAPQRTSTPDNFYTYEQVAQRVITLVEKNGDSRYNATVSGQQKIVTYLEFVYEAEKELIRREGYYNWLEQDHVIQLVPGQDTYELPQNFGELHAIYPLNFSRDEIREMTRAEFNRWSGRDRLSGSGAPVLYVRLPAVSNDRKRIRFFPVPGADSTATYEVLVSYTARMIRPDRPEEQIPFVPQEHIDALVYSAAHLAMLLDTDPDNRDAFREAAEQRVGSLIRNNNRKTDSRVTQFRIFDERNTRVGPQLRFDNYPQ